jgi:hypothetical protein
MATISRMIAHGVRRLTRTVVGPSGADCMAALSSCPRMEMNEPIATMMPSANDISINQRAI